MRRTNVFRLILLVGLAVLWIPGHAGVVSAGVNVWTSHGPEGGLVRALAIDPAVPSTLYVAIDPGGVFESTNGGGNWTDTGLMHKHVHCLAIDRATPTTLYAGTWYGGVFKSTNGGVSWSVFNSGLTATDVWALAIDPLAPTTLYAGTGYGGVFKSTNGGGYWFAVNNGVTATDVRTLAIDPATPTTLYAGAQGGGVFKSVNGGGNWSAVNTGLGNTAVLALAIDQATPTTLYAGTWGGGVFKSTDGAGHWFAVNTGLTNTHIQALAIDPETPATLYAGTTWGGLFKSTAGGGDWRAVNTGLTAGRVLALAIDPATPTTVYAGTEGGGVFKTANSGGSWRAFNTGLMHPHINALAIDPATPTTLYAGLLGGGVFKTANRGRTWSEVNTGLTNTDVRALAIDPVTPATLYAATEGEGVVKSTNGGLNWTRVTTGLSTQYRIEALVIDPATPTTLYAGTYGQGVFKSTNGGGNWGAANTGLTATWIRSLAIDPAMPATVYAGTGSGVFKSTAGGGNWSAVNAGLVNTDVLSLGIDPATPTTLYAGTYGGGVFKSTNGGGDWRAVNTGLTEMHVWAVTIDPAMPTTVYVATDGGVFKSTNGGGNWAALNTGLTYTWVHALAIDPATPTTLYAGTHGGGVFDLQQGYAIYLPLTLRAYHQQPLKITVGTDATWPPFEYVDETTQDIVGFDMDLLKAVAQAGGFEYRLVNVPWDPLLAGMATGQYDAAISAMTITEERAKLFDFAIPYYNAGQVIAVRIDDERIQGVADLAGKTVGAQLGTTGAIYLENMGGVTLRTYDILDDAFLDLINGQLDAVVADNPLVLASVGKSGGQLKRIGEPFTDEWYGIAVRKNAQQILAAINRGLTTVLAQGIISQLEDRWIKAPPEPKSLLKTIQKVDDYTLKITLNRPDPAFLFKLALAPFSIQSPTQIQEYGGGGDFFKNPSGTGPFKLRGWIPDTAIDLEPFNGYWGQKPTPKRVVYRVIGEASARLSALQAGTVDIIDDVDSEDIAGAEADPNLKVAFRPPFTIGYLGINRNRPPFDRVEVRQAIAMAIDKAVLVQALYPPTASVAKEFIPPGVFGYSAGLVDWEYNPTRARQLLATAGLTNGFTTTLWVMPVARTYFPAPDKVGQVIQANLQAVGIHAEIVTYDWGAYLDKTAAGEADLFMLGWIADYPDATNFLDVFFTGGDQSLGDAFPEILQALGRARTEADAVSRQQLYDQANQLIHDLVPAVPIAHGPSAVAMKKTVSGFLASPLEVEFMRPVTVQGTDTVIMARSYDSIGLDPADETDPESFRVATQIMEPLLTYKPGTAELAPALAESWEWSTNLKEWTFHLRRGVKFHDGTDLNADAVILNLERCWNKASPYHTGHNDDFFYWAYFFGGFKGE